MSETTPTPGGSPKRARVRKTAAKNPRAARSQGGATPADRTRPADSTTAAGSMPSAESSAMAQYAAVPRSQPQSAELHIRSLQLRPVDRLSMIATAAYFRAERRRFAPGHELEDWIAAEAEIESTLSAPNRAVTRTEDSA